MACAYTGLGKFPVQDWDGLFLYTYILETMLVTPHLQMMESILGGNKERDVFPTKHCPRRALLWRVPNSLGHNSTAVHTWA